MSRDYRTTDREIHVSVTVPSSHPGRREARPADRTSRQWHRLVFDHGGPEPAAFFGTYVEVKPYSRLAWTNDEGGEGGSVTTVTFEEKGGKTLVVLHESHPSKEALDAAGTGAADAMVETFDQLDELLGALGESSGQ